MESTQITIITALAVPAIAASCTYYFAKKREREAELRREKLKHYKDFVTCLSGIVEGESTPEAQQRFALSSTKLNLVGSQQVIDALNAYMNIIDKPCESRCKNDCDRAQFELFYQLRHDLGMKDDKSSLECFLWPPNK